MFCLYVILWQYLNGMFLSLVSSIIICIYCVCWQVFMRYSVAIRISMLASSQILSQAHQTRYAFTCNMHVMTLNM